MNTVPEDRIVPPSADKTSSDAPVVTPPTQPKATSGKSWGDKYKDKAHHLIRDVLVNYIVNFSMSALGTYGVVESKWYQRGVQPWLDDKVMKLSNKTGMPGEFAAVIVKFFTVTQLLLCGGHSLLPFMKWTHDNRKRQEFKLGHILDKTQMMLGRGDAATKQRIAEYHYINDLLKADRPQDLTEDDKKLLAKNFIDDHLQFQENRQTWKQVLKARGLGMSFTTTLSFLLATGSYFGKQSDSRKWMNVEDTYLKGVGHSLGEGLHYNKIVHDHERLVNGVPVTVRGDHVLGEYTILELIYTAATKLGFDHMEKRQLHKQEAREKADAEASLAREREKMAKTGSLDQDAPDMLSQRTSSSITPSALEARRKLVEDGGKDFRAREAAKPPEQPGMAVS